MAKYRLDLKTSPSRTKSTSFGLPDGEKRVETARKIKGYLKILLSVPVVIALLYVGSVLYNRERVVPRGVETVQDFYHRYGNPPRVEGLQTGGRRFYRIIGEIPAPLGFPKGNPIYVFDGTGRMIDWTPESLADPAFAARWDGITPEQLSVAYFLEKFPPN